MRRWLNERVKLPKLRVEKRMLSVLDDTPMRALIGYECLLLR